VLKIAITKIDAVNNFNAGKITQTSGTKSEHKHSKIQRFWMLNEPKFVKTKKSPLVSIANKFSDLH